jgi:glycosyltransferase involved in cell wall biosynthesis
MTKLRILLGNNTLSLLAGSETWVYTLAVQLKKMGHTVHCFSPELGIIAQKLADKDIPSFAEINTSGVRPFTTVLEEKVEHEYDVIIANHNHIVAYLRSQFPRTPIISTIHGIIHTMPDGRGNDVPAPEHPAMESGVNQFVAVSEEVRDLLRATYNIDSVIIRNFIDTDVFKSNKRPRITNLKTILFNSNYQSPDDPEVQVLREVAKHYGARLMAVGQEFTTTFDMMTLIEQSDIVVGMGRSVLEGVSAGRLGIVHGRWGTGGFILPETVDVIRACNFSGRNAEGVLYTKEQFIEHIDTFYTKEMLDWGKNYIRKDHNAAIAAQAYVELARALLGQDIVPATDGRRPYRRQRDVK